jgi:hypothetical protein
MTLFLRLAVFAIPFVALGAPIGLVDLDTKAVEIRFGGFVSLVEAENGTKSVKMRVCKNPQRDFETLCEGNALESTAIAKADFDAHLEAYFDLKQKEDLQSERAEKESIIQWSRSVLRQKLAQGSGAAAEKENAENLLLEMVDQVEPTTIEKALSKKREVFEQIAAFLVLPELQKSAETYFRESDPIAFESLISPFAVWLHHNTCRCEIAWPAKEKSAPECQLRKGGSTIAFAPATLGACETRRDCLGRSWFGEGSNQGALQFLDVVESQCGGFFTPGSFELGPKKEGLSHGG